MYNKYLFYENFGISAAASLLLLEISLIVYSFVVGASPRLKFRNIITKNIY